MKFVTCSFRKIRVAQFCISNTLDIIKAFCEETEINNIFTFKVHKKTFVLVFLEREAYIYSRTSKLDIFSIFHSIENAFTNQIVYFIRLYLSIWRAARKMESKAWKIDVQLHIACKEHTWLSNVTMEANAESKLRNKMRIFHKFAVTCIWRVRLKSFT